MSGSGRHWSASAALAFTAVLLALETGCSLLLYNGWQALPLLLHIVASLAANVMAWRRCSVANPPVATLRLTTMLMPFLGPVAPLAAVALLVAQAIRRSVPPDAATWHEHLFPNLAADPINDRMEAIARRQPSSATGEDVESFYDVLRWGTLQEREHVLSLISRSFRAEFAPVLGEALASPDLGLRAQAAAGLSLLETRTSARLSVLQQSWKQATENARELEAVNLARALAEAAHSGLYDELRTVEMRAEIVSLLMPVVARSGNPALAAILGRTMIHLGDLDGAVAALDRCVISSGDKTDAAFAWLLEGLFRQGDFARLAASLQRHREQATLLVARDGPLAPALNFWSNAT